MGIRLGNHGEVYPDGELCRTAMCGWSYKAIVAASKNRCRNENGNSANAYSLSPTTIARILRGEPVRQWSMEKFARCIGVAKWTQLVKHEGAAAVPNGINDQLSLPDCLSNFKTWEGGLPPDDELVIQTIAIDMARGHSHVLEVINSAKSTKIRFEILMLTGDPKRIVGLVPQPVSTWSKVSEHYLELLRTELASYCGAKLVSVKVKRYPELPTIHGVDAKKGSVRRCWVTQCDYVGSEIESYDWSERGYSVIAHDEKSEKLNQLTESFRSRFLKLWANSELVIDESLRSTVQGASP